MMTSLNGNIPSLLALLCAGNSPFTSEFPSQPPVTRSFNVFFDLRLNKRLSKQSRRRWFETSPHSLWRHCNGLSPYGHLNITYRNAVLWAIEFVTGIELQWIRIKIQINFFQENAIQNVVCKMSAILSWPQCVNSSYSHEDNRSLVRNMYRE